MTTKNATATYWQASATIVSAWNSSWQPKIRGKGKVLYGAMASIVTTG